MTFYDLLKDFHRIYAKAIAEETTEQLLARKHVIVFKGHEFHIDDACFDFLKITYSDANRYKWKQLESSDTIDCKWEVKDYGPQVSWRTVYIVEYFGALVAMPLVMWVQNPIQLARMDVVLWIIHYGLRLYESMFVHTFSSETMPLKNIF